MSPKCSSLCDKLIALECALMDRDPLLSATCAVPGRQRFLYFPDGDHFRRIDFTNASMDELDALYRACKPEFGWNRKLNLDESSIGKAGKMDFPSFATPFDPRGLGIHDQVTKALHPDGDTTRTVMGIVLCKLNVYGVGDFFRPHKDTPRSNNMFGSLVVVLPTHHEGGQLVLRKDRKRWNIDFADTFAAATEPSACFIAFNDDIELELLPITSGYCVTLTYKLFYKPIDNVTHPSMSSIPTPYHQKLRQVVVDLVNDRSVLPEGGYLGFALAHDYVQLGCKEMVTLQDQLKGSDRDLADICKALGLSHSVKLLYRRIFDEMLPNVNLITTEPLVVRDADAEPLESGDPETLGCFSYALESSTIEKVEGVNFVGDESKMDASGLTDWLTTFYKDPITEVLEVTPIESSSLSVSIPCLVYVSGVSLMFYYGKGCMLIAVEPAKSRELVG